jgi:putative flippase GtrA
MPGLVSLRKRFAELLPELAKFGVVGLIGSVVDLGGAAYLHGALGIGPMVSKGLSITAATVITYLGSRFWTFRHRVNQNLLREGTLFVALNVVGLAIAECVIALVTYGFGLKGTLAYNAASVAGTGLGTIFRYFSYKKWVFLADTPGAAVAAGEAAVSGLVDANEVAPVPAARSEPVPAARSEPVLAARSDRHQRRYVPAHAVSSRAARSSPDPYAPAGERRYGPPWETLDAAEAPRR